VLTTIECFAVLELPPGASGDQVRAAWRDLVKVWHPDRFAHDPELRRRAEAKLKRVNEAYELLRTGRARRDAASPRWTAEPSRAAPTRVAFRPAHLHAGIARLSLGLMLSGTIGGFVLVRLNSALDGGLDRSIATELDAPLREAATRIETEAVLAAIVPTASRSAPELLAHLELVRQLREGPRPAEPERPSPVPPGAPLEWSYAASPSPPVPPQRRAETGPSPPAAPVPRPDPRLAHLDRDARQRVEDTCALSRRRGPAAHERCLDHQLAWLSATVLRPAIPATNAVRD
jgi:hypothetical protein